MVPVSMLNSVVLPAPLCPRMTLMHAQSSYLDHCRRHGLAHNTVRGYEGRLRKFIEYAGD